MSSGIRLDRKHGVNPSVGVCFWCGEDDGTVVLVGANGGKEAPHRGVYSYEPCSTCQEQFNEGVLLLEVSLTAPKANMPPINLDTKKYRQGRTGGQQALFPTGRLVVIKPEAVERIFDEVMATAAVAMKKAFIDEQAFQELFGEVVEERDGD